MLNKFQRNDILLFKKIVSFEDLLGENKLFELLFVNYIYDCDYSEKQHWIRLSSTFS